MGNYKCIASNMLFIKQSNTGTKLNKNETERERGGDRELELENFILQGL